MGSIRVCAMIFAPENRYISVIMHLSYYLASILGANVPSNNPKFGGRGSESMNVLVLGHCFYIA
jgi:hypothetical protein